MMIHRDKQMKIRMIGGFVKKLMIIQIYLHSFYRAYILYKY